MSDLWYQEINDSKSLTQGDIIPRCPIPLPGRSIYEGINAAGNAESPNLVDERVSLDTIEADVVVLTQACDIEQNKVESVVLCPVWPLKDLIREYDHFRSKDKREDLRQGREPAFHLINEHRSKAIDQDYSVVEFHRIFTVPLEFLSEVAKNRSPRLRLRPPYREHLAQAFARYFMRVGLPVDIDKAAIKDYQFRD